MHWPILSRFISWKPRSRNKNGTQYLPQEVVHIILRHLSLGTQPRHYLSYELYGDALFQRRIAIHGVSRRDILNSALVCRTWYCVAVEFLYTELHITGAKALHSLTTTVEGSKDLARMIQRLCIAAFLNKGRIAALTGPSRAQYRDYVLRILAACPCITSFDFSADPKVERSLGTAFSENVSSPIHTLRELTIRDKALGTLLPFLRLPRLEVLRICQSYGDDSGHYVFPSLPCLHTLQVIQNMDQSPILLQSVQLPSLRTLQLLNNGGYPLVLGIEDPSNFSYLERIEVIGMANYPFPGGIPDNPITNNIKHLVLGPITERAEWISTWIYPQTLESLALYAFLESSVAILEYVMECLTFNVLECRNSRLQRLGVMLREAVVPSIPWTDRLKALLESVQTFCRRHSISFEIGRINIDDWCMKTVRQPMLSTAEGTQLQPMLGVTPIKWVHVENDPYPPQTVSLYV